MVSTWWQFNGSLDVVGAVLGRSDALPAGGQSLPVQRMRPMSGLRVVIDEELAPAKSEVHRPAGGQRGLGFRGCGQVLKRTNRVLIPETPSGGERWLRDPNFVARDLNLSHVFGR